MFFWNDLFQLFEPLFFFPYCTRSLLCGRWEDIERWLAEAMYESKLSGLRGKAAREALLEAEAHEKKAAEAVEAEANLGTF